MSSNFTDINEIMDEFPDEDGTYEPLKAYLNKIIKISLVQNNDNDGSGIPIAAFECLKILDVNATLIAPKLGAKAVVPMQGLNQTNVSAEEQAKLVVPMQGLNQTNVSAEEQQKQTRLAAFKQKQAEEAKEEAAKEEAARQEEERRYQAAEKQNQAAMIQARKEGETTTEEYMTIYPNVEASMDVEHVLGKDVFVGNNEEAAFKQKQAEEAKATLKKAKLEAFNTMIHRHEEADKKAVREKAVRDAEKKKLEEEKKKLEEEEEQAALKPEHPEDEKTRQERSARLMDLKQLIHHHEVEEEKAVKKKVMNDAEMASLKQLILAENADVASLYATLDEELARNNEIYAEDEASPTFEGGGQVSNPDNDQKNKNVDIKLLIEALMKLQESFDAYMRGIAVVVNNSAGNPYIGKSNPPIGLRDNDKVKDSTQSHDSEYINTDLPEIVDVNTKLTDFNKAIDSWIKATGTDTTTNPSLSAIVVDNDKLVDFNKAIDSWITATGTGTTTNPSLSAIVDVNDQLVDFNKAIDSWITATGTAEFHLDEG